MASKNKTRRITDRLAGIAEHLDRVGDGIRKAFRPLGTATTPLVPNSKPRGEQPAARDDGLLEAFKGYPAQVKDSGRYTRQVDGSWRRAAGKKSIIKKGR